MKTVLFSEFMLEDLDEAKSNLDHVLCFTEVVKEKKRGDKRPPRTCGRMNSQEDLVQSKPRYCLPLCPLEG